MTVKALRDRALTLPLSEKLSLVEELWDSIAEDQKSLPLSDARGSIIDERLAADEADPNAVVSWKNAVQHAPAKGLGKEETMKSPLALRLEARADLVDAGLWYETQSQGLSEDFFACIGAALETIQERPVSFPTVHKDVRRALVKRFPYAIYFRRKEDYILVLAILHTARSPHTVRKRT